jgi:hypothetical protein
MSSINLKSETILITRPLQFTIQPGNEKTNNLRRFFWQIHDSIPSLLESAIKGFLEIVVRADVFLVSCEFLALVPNARRFRHYVRII